MFVFGGIETQVGGLGTVLLSASGDASAQIFTVTVDNRLSYPIKITSFTVKEVMTGNKLSCTCSPNPVGSIVPAGQPVTYTCDCSASKTRLVSGNKYVVIITYPTSGGVTKTTTTTFTAT